MIRGEHQYMVDCIILKDPCHFFFFQTYKLEKLVIFWIKFIFYKFFFYFQNLKLRKLTWPVMMTSPQTQILSSPTKEELLTIHTLPVLQSYAMFLHIKERKFDFLWTKFRLQWVKCCTTTSFMLCFSKSENVDWIIFYGQNFVFNGLNVLHQPVFCFLSPN